MTGSEKKRREKSNGILKNAYIAHRGLHDGKSIPENSLGAINLAAKKGVVTEIDIRLSADGEVIVFHDDFADRLCGVHRHPEDMTLAEIKKLRLLGTHERIPTLSECLNVCGGRVPLLIEFKTAAHNGARLCRAADRILSRYDGEYLVQSFYPSVLLWYRTHRADVPRGQLSSAYDGKIPRLRTLGALLFRTAANSDFISLEYSWATEAGFALLGKFGVPVIGWTFKSEKSLEKYADFFDGYIFEGFIPKKAKHGE